MRLLFGSRLVGRSVLDSAGTWIGEVTDTWPLDGGGLPELILVKVGRRFPRLRYLPVESADLSEPGTVRVPYTRLEIDDAPRGDDFRWGDPGHVALAYWTTVGD